jgi:hypothetical protein
MKKLQTAILASMVPLALSAVLTGSASALVTLLAEWLINGAQIMASLPATTKGEFLLEDLSNKAFVICGMALVHNLMSNGVDETTKILNMEELEEITEVKPLLTCQQRTGSACENVADIEFLPKNLPWETLLALDEGGAYEDYSFLATYVVRCLIIGVLVSDECTSPSLAAGGSGTVLVNGTFAVEVEEGRAASPESNCSVGGNKTGLIEPFGKVDITSPEGFLAVSSAP